MSPSIREVERINVRYVNREGEERTLDYDRADSETSFEIDASPGETVVIHLMIEGNFQVRRVFPPETGYRKILITDDKEGNVVFVQTVVTEKAG